MISCCSMQVKRVITPGSPPNRWQLRLQLCWSLQKVGLHKKRQPQLVGECQGLSSSLPRASIAEQLQGRSCRGSGNQRLHTPKACDGGAERGEATQSCEDPAEQEDGPFLWASPDWHHWCHQAGLWSGEEDLHTGGETGENVWLQQRVDLIGSFWLFVAWNDVRHGLDLVWS